MPCVRAGVSVLLRSTPDKNLGVKHRSESDDHGGGRSPTELVCASVCACTKTHRVSFPSPGAPRLAPERLRGVGTALWIPTESSDSAEPGEATRGRPPA